MLKFTVVAPTNDSGAISLLFDNLDLILANKQTILSQDKFSNIKIQGIFVGGLYVGMHELLLGDILTLWETTPWHTDTRLYYNIIGSPLSGTNNAHWYNNETKKIESGAYFNGNRGFLSLAKYALEHIQRQPKNRVVSKLSISDLLNTLQHMKVNE